MSEFTFSHDKYKFEIKLQVDQINIKLTDIELLDLYEGSVKETDIYVKPIKKFYTMIEKAFSREPNYNFTIQENKSQLYCCFAYNNEMVDIEETVTFTKVNTQKTKELLLIDRVKELTEIATPEFGYRDFGEIMTFNIDSKFLDFRPYDDYTRHTNFSDYNKFKKVRKIIMSTKSNVFCVSMKQNVNSDTITYDCGCKATIKAAAAAINATTAAAIASTTAVISSTVIAFSVLIGHTCPIHGGYQININRFLDAVIQFNHPSVYMPSVTEVEVHCSPYNELVRDFTKFRSLPNLEKLVLIQSDNTGFSSAFLDVHCMISTIPTKKLKHIILKNMSQWIKSETVEKAKLFAQVNHISLEII